MKRIKAMKRAWKIGMIFGVFICTILSSCYDKIDDFDILSGTEYVIERGTDTTIYIHNFRKINKFKFHVYYEFIR